MGSPPPEFLKLAAGLTGFWCVAGGWAIDFHLGRQTREHEDLEMVVLREDHQELYAHFKDSQPEKIISGEPPEFIAWRGEKLDDEIIQIRVALTGGAGELDLLLTPSAGGEWICRRDPSLRLPLEEIIRRTADGQPYLAPAIVLLFKAKYVREKDAADFKNVLRVLSTRERNWLKAGLEKIHPGHEWLTLISPAPAPE